MPGMTQRDVMGREVGGGFMFENACTSMVDSCQCIIKIKKKIYGESLVAHIVNPTNKDKCVGKAVSQLLK